MGALRLLVLMSFLFARCTIVVKSQEQCSVENAGLQICESKLKELESELDSLKSQLATATKEVAASTTQSDTERIALKKNLSEAEEKIRTLENKVLTLEKKLLQEKASAKLANSEAAQFRRRVEEADRSLKELSEHHTSAWLPHWLEQRVGWALQEALPAARAVVMQGYAATSHAYDLSLVAWKTHAYPVFKNLRNVLSEKGLALAQTAGAFLAEHGITWPAGWVGGVQASWNTIQAAWRSETAIILKRTIVNGFSTFVDIFTVVIAELQQLIMKLAHQYSWAELLLDPTLATCAAYIVVFAPIIAIGLPLLASRQSSSRPSPSLSAQGTPGKGGSRLGSARKNPAQKKKVRG